MLRLADDGGLKWADVVVAIVIAIGLVIVIVFVIVTPRP